MLNHNSIVAMDISSYIRFGTAETVSDIDWEAVYISLLPKVFHYFAYRLGDQQLAEDLTASTFERAWRKRKKYRHDLGGFSNWVFGIARNVAREHFRKPHFEIELDERNGPPSTRQTEGHLREKEDFQRLATLLARLPARQRDLIALKYGAEMTNRTIAKATGLSETNVGTILHRVVSKLRKQWELENE